MREIALFYNFSDDRLRKAKFALLPLKISVKAVPIADFNQPLGYLVGVKGVEKVEGEYNGNEFTEEMIVMHNFTSVKIDMLIKALAKSGVGRVPLKAVVTPINKDWDSISLYKAVKADHEEMSRN